MTEIPLVSGTEEAISPNPWSSEAQEARDDEWQNSGVLASRFIERANNDPSDDLRFANDFLEGVMLRADEKKITSNSEAYAEAIASVDLLYILDDFESKALKAGQEKREIPFDLIPESDGLRDAIKEIAASGHYDAIRESLRKRIELQRELQDRIKADEESKRFAPPEAKELGGAALDSVGAKEPEPMITHIPENILNGVSAEEAESDRSSELLKKEAELSAEITELLEGLSDEEKRLVWQYAVAVHANEIYHAKERIPEGITQRGIPEDYKRIMKHLSQVRSELYGTK